MVRTHARWALRDWLAAAALFTATAGVVLWQNAHLAVLWDLSYTLDTATRIALGQLPYRDFPLAHAPLTFLIQAGIIRLTGRVFFHHVLYAAIAGDLGTVLTWRIALRILLDASVPSAWPIAIILAAPLSVLGLYCILPLPSYDCDCAFAILVAVWLLQRLEPWLPSSPTAFPTRNFGRPFAFLAGAALCLPIFFKQNIGLPFLAAASAILLLPLIAGFLYRTSQNSPSPWIPLIATVFAGVAATLLAALLLIHFTVGLGNYVHWTLQFAAQRRLPGLPQMLGVYSDPQLLWTLPCIAIGLLLLRIARMRWTQTLAVALLAAPFVYTLCSLLIYDDADERGDSLLGLWPMLLIIATALAIRDLLRLRRHLGLGPLLPILLLVAIHGTLMSQQLWGSTYAIWPLFILLIAGMIAYLARLPGSRPRFIAPVTAVTVATTLLICGSFYTASEERLSYAQFPGGPATHSAFPQLAGIATPGPYLPNFDELLRYASGHIPSQDGLILLPGEDPFYFVTGRTPQFPVLLFDPATDPYSPAQLVNEARQHNIRWLIVKRELQIKEDPMPQRDAALHLLLSDFTLAARLHGYDVYRRP
jgi:hypothetical protein